MKTLTRLLLLVSLASFGAFQAAAQTPSKTARPRTARPAAAPKKKDPRAEGAARVAAQVKNLTRFLYLFGSVSKDLAAADEAIKRGEAPPDAAARSRQNKAALLSSLANVRDGLDKLEADFRFTPELQNYYPQLKGVAAAAAAAEDLSANGKYDEAGRNLLAAVNQLTDVLLAMR